MLIERFFQTGRDFLDCRIPIMCGAMTWVSDPKLVTAVGRAGGFGLLAGGNAPVEVLKEQIETTRSLSDHPHAISFWTKPTSEQMCAPPLSAPHSQAHY